MAQLTPAQSDWIDNMQKEALLLLDSQVRIKRLVTEYNEFSYGTEISDNDLLESNFHDITNTTLVNSVVAVTSVDTALGNLVGGQAGNLLKLLRGRR